jgi:hypothetical protein
VDELNKDKSINEKVLFHLGINKKPNFEKINNFVGQASLVISLIKFPRDKFHNKTNLSFDNVKMKSEPEKGCTIDTTVPLCAYNKYNGFTFISIFLI